MKDYDQDHLLVDVADALTLHREVQWDRCERLATPANRQVLDNLRALSGLFAGGRSGAGDARSRRVELAPYAAGREAFRAARLWLLLCGRLPEGILGLLVLVLGWLVASRPERPVGAVLADPLLQALAVVAGVLLMLAAVRKRIVVRLDAWPFLEVVDKRHALAHAAAALAGAVEPAAVSRTVNRTARCGCGSPATLLVAAGGESGRGDLVAPDGSMAPLSRSSAIVYLLETAGRPLRVHRDDTTSLFALLPPDDAAWSGASGADAVVPVPGPGAELLGVLVVKRRLDHWILRRLDLPFLEALGAVAGLALERLRLTPPGTPPREVPPPASAPSATA